jgi:hypothetical protein
MAQAVLVFAIEDGFLCRPGHPDIGVPNAQRFVFLPVPGIEDGVMFFRYRTARQADLPGAECFVLMANLGGDPKGVAEENAVALERAFPHAMHVLLLDARTGWARAMSSSATAASEPELAAAVAAVCAGASWDESDPILVELDGATFAVRLEHAGTFWRATIRGQGATAP